MKKTTLTVLFVGSICACPRAPEGPSAPSTQRAICGDNDRDGREKCDGDDLANKSCVDLGFGAGTLLCKPTCDDFDRSGCGAPASCGDGNTTGVEICDGSSIGEANCESLGYGAGTLGCLSNCADYDVSGCGPPPGCGDGRRQNVEVCDRDDFDGLRCRHLGFESGDLRCDSDCMGIDTSDCNGTTCTPTTCAAEGKNCGEIDDGCGVTLSCGSCTLPETCGGGGTAKVCGQDSTCIPTTCAAEGKNCGEISDLCGGTLSCGTCTDPETCGGGGTANVCGCTPQSCQDQDKNCGSIDDKCGNTISCGTCESPESCGGGGFPNLCGCSPSASCSAIGADCGKILDGCRYTLDCGGSCTSPAVCGGGGQPNICAEGTCTPTTCAAEGAACGRIPDGCGGMLDCGTCTGSVSCGVGGAPNQCGQRTCQQPRDCPYGQLCQSGMCRDDNDSTLCGDCEDIFSPCTGIGQQCLINAFYDSSNPRTNPPSYCTRDCSVSEDCPSGMECRQIFNIVGQCSSTQACDNGQACMMGEGASWGYCPCTSDADCTAMGASTCNENGLCPVGQACALLDRLQCADLGLPR